jgi:hypothetical protein
MSATKKWSRTVSQRQKSLKHSVRAIIVSGMKIDIFMLPKLSKGQKYYQLGPVWVVPIFYSFEQPRQKIAQR